MIIFLIDILYMLQIGFQATWEGQLLSPGQSNHIFQIVQLCSFICVIGLCAKSNNNWKQVFIIIGIYPLLRFSLFDYYINFARGLDLGYISSDEVIKQFFGNSLVIFRIISLILVILLTIKYIQIFESKIRKL